MAMSRNIPINVHPGFRWRTTSGDQGKPRTFSRSFSLPCEPKIKLFVETSNPSRGDKEQDSTEENTAEIPRQAINDMKRNENDKYSEFWSLPDLLKGPKFSEGTAGRLKESEEKEKRRHFFTENPVVEDLERVFENYYTSSLPSRPIKLGRRNTYGPGEESHLAPKLTRRNVSGVNSETSFDIPIYVESNERKDGTDESEGNNVSESEARKENVIREDQTIKQISEAENEKVSEPKINAFREEICASVKDNKECVLEKPDDNSDECGINLHHEEGNIDQGQNEVNNMEPCEPIEIPPLQPQHTEAEHNESKKKLLKIQSILKKADDLEKEVTAFCDSTKTKEYLILEEVLTCCLIDLDGIETNQDEIVRVARKQGVQMLQKTLARLEGKITSEPVENKGDEKAET